MAGYQLPVDFSLAWSAKRLLRAHAQTKELALLARRTGEKFENWPRIFITEVLPDGQISTRTDAGDFMDEYARIADNFEFEATMLFSEAIHNIRSALDYCIFLATLKQTGRESRDTMFPMWQARSRWSANDKKIKHLSDEQRRWVQEVQPFNDVEWSWWLSQLSNADKHRSPVVLAATAQFTTPSLDPGYAVGDEIPTIDRSFELPIADFEHPEGGHSSIDARVLLEEMTIGAIGVVNKFLVEEGFDPITITTKGD